MSRGTRNRDRRARAAAEGVVVGTAVKLTQTQSVRVSQSDTVHTHATLYDFHASKLSATTSSPRICSNLVRQSVTEGRWPGSRRQQSAASSTSSKAICGCLDLSRKVSFNPSSFSPNLSFLVSSMMSCASLAVSASVMTMPNEKMSADSPYSPFNTSGAWCEKVPCDALLPRRLLFSSDAPSRAQNPKS